MPAMRFFHPKAAMNIVARFMVAAFAGFTGGAARTEGLCGPSAEKCCALAPRPALAEPAPPSLGVQVWPGELSERPEVTAKLVAFRPAQLRFSFGTTWRKQPALATTTSDADLDAYVAAAYGSVKNIEKMRDTMNAVKKATGALLNMVVWDGPRLPGDGDYNDPKTEQQRVLRAENVGLLARFHVANFRFLNAFGLALDAAELSNEPDGPWNMQIQPAVYLELVLGTRQEANRRGVRLPQIYGPGASRAEAARAMFDDPRVAREIIDAVDVVSLHVWDDAAGQDKIAELEAFLARIAQLDRKPKIAITEYGLVRPDPRDKSERMDASKRIPGSVTETPAYVAESLRELLRIYAERIGAVVYWEFKDQSWGQGLYGLLGVDGEAKPIYDEFRKLNAFLRDTHPDFVANSPDGDLALLENVGVPGGVLIAVNPSPQAKEIVINEQVIAATGSDSCVSAEGQRGVHLAPGEIITETIVGPSP